jgi:GntR family transcriptional regulator
MNIEVNFRSGVPIYVQIMDQVKHMVATGEIKPGDQLPTVRQMAADLRVNFNTIARAYRLLDEAGIISTQHGRGTFILELPSEANGERLRKEDLLRLTRHYLTEAHRLDYPPEKVKEIFESQYHLWEESGTPPSPEDDKI